MSYLFNNAKYNNQLYWGTLSSGWKIILINDYEFDYNNIYVSELSSYEISGTNYTPGYNKNGRKDLVNRTISALDDKIYLDADDITWNSINAGYCDAAVIIFESGGSDSNSLLYAYINNGFPVRTRGGDLTISWNASGIINIS